MPRETNIERFTDKLRALCRKHNVTMRSVDDLIVATDIETDEQAFITDIDPTEELDG